jgi:predicted phage tail protein
MRRKIFLHGPYKAYHDGPIEIEAATPWDALEAVVSQIKGFRPLGGKRQQIQCAGYKTMSELKTPDDREDLHIFPPMNFGKQNGIVQTIIGVTLLVLVATAAIVMGGPLTFLGQMVLSAGIALTAGGLMALLTPQPKAAEPEARSKYLPSTGNTVAIGTPIALLYGKFRCGGQIMSLAVDAKSQPTA